MVRGKEVGEWAVAGTPSVFVARIIDTRINYANWVGKSIRRLWNRFADPRIITNM